MNAATPESDRRGAIEETAEAQTKKPASAELDAIKAHLGQGMSGFARQGDIVQLHKRLEERLSAIPAALGGAERLARLEQIEQTLTSLEAALRVELAPLLRQTVAQTLRETAQPARRRGGGWRILLVAGLGVAVGCVFSAEILAIVDTIATWIAR